MSAPRFAESLKRVAHYLYRIATETKRKTNPETFGPWHSYEEMVSAVLYCR